MKPKWLRIGGYWYPRGGMPIDVFWQSRRRRRKGCGCPTRASRLIAAGAAARRSRSSAPVRSAASSAAPGPAAGLPVTFIGRPKIAQDIAEHGLTLSDYGGWQAQLGDVDYRCGPAALAEADIIALCVKSGATAEAARRDCRARARRRAGHQLPERRQQRRRARARAGRPVRDRARHGAVQCRLSRAKAVSTKASPAICRSSGARDRSACRSDRHGPGGAQAVRTTCSASRGASCSSTSTMRSMRCPAARLIEELKQRDYRRVVRRRDARGAATCSAAPESSRRRSGRSARACCRG